MSRVRFISEQAPIIIQTIKSGEASDTGLGIFNDFQKFMQALTEILSSYRSAFEYGIGYYHIAIFDDEAGEEMGYEEYARSPSKKKLQEVLRDTITEAYANKDVDFSTMIFELHLCGLEKFPLLHKYNNRYEKDTYNRDLPEGQINADIIVQCIVGPMNRLTIENLPAGEDE